ncbi:MAG: hypothetical protein HKN80_15305 [Acidimicrobiia bacterium]|nr:hypothetical protein [Acidimicrobiia bacterium]
MNDAWIFSIGAVLFIFLTWATIVFLSLRFSELYRVDQASSAGAPEIIMEGNTEVLTTKEGPTP